MKRPMRVPVLCALALWMAAGAAFGQAPVRLVEAWTLVHGLSRPESVVYDDARQVLYVSNISDTSPENGKRGYIARVALDGSLIDSAWVAGLNAPKGLALVGDLLYVAENDALTAVDVTTGAVSARYPVEGETFLNDVAADAHGTVYVSDSRTGRVHRLHDGRFEVWLDDPNVRSPNGLFVVDDGVLLAAGDTTAENAGNARYLRHVSPDGRTLHPFGDGQPQGGLDAIEADGHGGYFLSDWPGGRVLYQPATGAPIVLLTLTQGTADLDYVAAQQMLYLPVMTSGQLIAYRVERTP